MMKFEFTSPKDYLERDSPIEVGDFVTTDDRLLDIFIYVVKEINGDMIKLYGLSLSDSRDDVAISEITTKKNRLIKLGEEYVNQAGILNNIRSKILRGESSSIKVSPFYSVIL